MDYLERCYNRSPDIVSRKIANKVILVPIRHNVGDLESIYTLNEVATRIWELVDGRRKIYQIRDIILEEFEVTPQKIEKDLTKYARELENIDAIKVK